jgi:hypothetical protein
MIETSMPLSKNFTIGELLRSNTLERDENLKAEQYNPPSEIIDSRYILGNQKEVYHDI